MAVRQFFRASLPHLLLVRELRPRARFAWGGGALIWCCQFLDVLVCIEAIGMLPCLTHARVSCLEDWCRRTRLDRGGGAWLSGGARVLRNTCRRQSHTAKSQRNAAQCITAGRDSGFGSRAASSHAAYGAEKTVETVATQ